MNAPLAKWHRLLITGAAGEIGSVIRPALADTAEALRTTTESGDSVSDCYNGTIKPAFDVF